MAIVMIGAFVQLVVVLMQVRMGRVMRRMGAMRRMRTMCMAVMRVMAEGVWRMWLMHRMPGLGLLLLGQLVGRRSVSVPIVGKATVVVGSGATTVTVGG